MRVVRRAGVSLAGWWLAGKFSPTMRRGIPSVLREIGRSGWSVLVSLGRLWSVRGVRICSIPFALVRTRFAAFVGASLFGRGAVSAAGWWLARKSSCAAGTRTASVLREIGRSEWSVLVSVGRVWTVIVVRGCSGLFGSVRSRSGWFRRWTPGKTGRIVCERAEVLSGRETARFQPTTARTNVLCCLRDGNRTIGMCVV